jgi:four helix bundle protein
MGTFKDLKAYLKAYKLASEIFTISKSFPEEEKFSLTSQIRRSSRSVCSNISEGYRKRQYKAHFISKLTDADMENSETKVWIDFAFQCGYLDHREHSLLQSEAAEIGNLLSYMISNPDKFIWHK